MYDYHAPLDPECPEVNEFLKFLEEDGMTHRLGDVLVDVVKSFESKHRAHCNRCLGYGLANVEVTVLAVA